MGVFSSYLKSKLLNHVFGCGDRNYTPPSALYVALSTTDPITVGLTEPPSAYGYSRVATDSTYWSVAGDGLIQNEMEIMFGPCSHDWGVISHFAVLDSASGGNILFAGAITSKVVVEGDAPIFRYHKLNFRLV